MNVEDALQMCSAPSPDFTGGEWCHAANTLAEEVRRLQEQRNEYAERLQWLRDLREREGSWGEPYEKAMLQSLLAEEKRMHVENLRGLDDRALAAEARCARLEQAITEIAEGDSFGSIHLQEIAREALAGPHTTTPKWDSHEFARNRAAVKAALHQPLSDDDMCEHGYVRDHAPHPAAGLERCPVCDG